MTETDQTPTEPSPERPGDAAPQKRMRFHPLWLVLILGLIPRFALLEFFRDQPIHIADAQDYNRLAISLVNTGSYLHSDGTLTSLRPPLYPALVAGLYWAFGTENLQAVRLAQVVISLLTTVTVYWLGVEIYSRKVGVWAAWIFCFYPTLLGFNNLILSEVLFTFLVSVVALLTTAVITRGCLKDLLMLGVVLGLGALTRSILWLFTPLMAAYLFLVRGPGLRQRCIAAVIPLICFAVTVGPWVYRNTQVHKTLTFIDVMGGRNVMMGNYEYTPLERSWATVTDVTGDQAWYRVLARENPDYRDLTQGQIDKLAMKHGVTFALTHPMLSIQRSLIKFFNFWQLDRTLVAGAMTGHFGELSKLTVLGLAFLICAAYAAVIFGAVFGAICVPPSDIRIRWMLVLTIVFPCLIHSIAFAHSRYHLPLIPIFAVYAAAALTSWRDVRRHRFFPAGVVVCVILVLSWVREFIFVDLTHFS